MGLIISRTMYVFPVLHHNILWVSSKYVVHVYVHVCVCSGVCVTMGVFHDRCVFHVSGDGNKVSVYRLSWSPFV